jgi:glycosyltransferase involved in cell wall biosynthesis
MADFVVLSTADWDHPLWTNKQHVAVSLAGLGHRVVYVDSLGLRPARPGRSDLRRILRRLRRAIWPLRQVRQNLWVLSPLVLPGGSSGWALGLNRLSLRYAFALVQRSVALRNMVLWTFNPLTCRYLDLPYFHSTVYHCVDRIQAQPGMPAALLEQEEQHLAKAVQVVFTTAPVLEQELRCFNPHTYYFGNVADTEHFSAALCAEGPRPSDLPPTSPLLMFVGAIDAYKLDLPMFEALVAATPTWTYVLIGPVGETDPSTDVTALLALPNVHWLGPRAYQQLPAYLACADVALLPLQLNEYTRRMFPMKFFEYLSAGCPVVATAIPSLRDQADVAWLCQPEADAFQAAIRCALAGQGPDREHRLRRAGLHSYRRRSEAMLERLHFHGLIDPELDQTTWSARAPFRYPLESAMALVVSPLVAGLDALALSSLSRRLLRGFLRRWPRNPSALSHAARQAITAGDPLQAREWIERLWLEDREAFVLHHLLFRRSARPSQLEDQVALFQTLATSTRLPLHFRGYCLVVLAYRAIELADVSLQRQCVVDLAGVIQSVSDDPGTYHCLRTNRENRAKLLISAQLTRLRVLMSLEDWPELDRCAVALMPTVQRYEPACIDPDTATRMTRNILRALAIEALMAWRAVDALRFDAALAQAQRMAVAAQQPELDPFMQAAQEDHRGFAADMVQALEAGRWPVERPEQRPARDRLVAAALLVLSPRLNWTKAAKAERLLVRLDSPRLDSPC